MERTHITQSIMNYLNHITVNEDTTPNATTLYPLLTRLTEEYKATKIFQDAREILIRLFEMTESGVPQELKDLVDKYPAATTPIPSPLAFRKVEAIDPESSSPIPAFQFGTYLEEGSAKPSLPFCDKPLDLKSEASPVEFGRIILTGEYSSTSTEPALVQFFLLVEALEVEINAAPKKTTNLFLNKLDGLISNPFVDAALSQIPHDNLELRRLTLLRYSLENLNDLYEDLDVDAPENFHTLFECIDARIKRAFNPPIFPEKPLIDANDKTLSGPISETTITTLSTHLKKFENSLTYHTPSEVVILTKMVESLLFNKAQKIFWEYCRISLPYKFFDQFKRLFDSKTITDLFCNLFIKVDVYLQRNASKTVVKLKPLPLEAIAPTPAPIAVASITPSRPRRFSKDLSNPPPSNFTSFAAGLEAIDKGDLSAALEHSNNLIKFYEYALDLSGRLLPPIKCDEALADFFCLISDQLEILQRGDPRDKDQYNANLAKLLECKKNVKEYFTTYNPIEQITTNLTAFIEGLENLHASSIFADLKAAKKPKA